MKYFHLFSFASLALAIRGAPANNALAYHGMPKGSYTYIAGDSTTELPAGVTYLDDVSVAVVWQGLQISLYNMSEAAGGGSHIQTISVRTMDPMSISTGNDAIYDLAVSHDIAQDKYIYSVAVRADCNPWTTVDVANNLVLPCGEAKLVRTFETNGINGAANMTSESMFNVYQPDNMGAAVGGGISSTGGHIIVIPTGDHIATYLPGDAVDFTTKRDMFSFMDLFPGLQKVDMDAYIPQGVPDGMTSIPNTVNSGNFRVHEIHGVPGVAKAALFTFNRASDPDRPSLPITYASFVDLSTMQSDTSPITAIRPLELPSGYVISDDTVFGTQVASLGGVVFVAIQSKADRAMNGVIAVYHVDNGANFAGDAATTGPAKVRQLLRVEEETKGATISSMKVAYRGPETGMVLAVSTTSGRVHHFTGYRADCLDGEQAFGEPGYVSRQRFSEVPIYVNASGASDWSGDPYGDVVPVLDFIGNTGTVSSPMPELLRINFLMTRNAANTSPISVHTTGSIANKVHELPLPIQMSTSDTGPCVVDDSSRSSAWWFDDSLNGGNIPVCQEGDGICYDAIDMSYRAFATVNLDAGYENPNYITWDSSLGGKRESYAGNIRVIRYQNFGNSNPRRAVIHDSDECTRLGKAYVWAPIESSAYWNSVPKINYGPGMRSWVPVQLIPTEGTASCQPALTDRFSIATLSNPTGAPLLLELYGENDSDQVAIVPDDEYLVEPAPMDLVEYAYQIESISGRHVDGEFITGDGTEILIEISNVGDVGLSRYVSISEETECGYVGNDIHTNLDDLIIKLGRCEGHNLKSRPDITPGPNGGQMFSVLWAASDYQTCADWQNIRSEDSASLVFYAELDVAYFANAGTCSYIYPSTARRFLEINSNANITEVWWGNDMTNTGPGVLDLRPRVIVHSETTDAERCTPLSDYIVPSARISFNVTFMNAGLVGGEDPSTYEFSSYGNLGDNSRGTATHPLRRKPGTLPLLNHTTDSVTVTVETMTCRPIFESPIQANRTEDDKGLPGCIFGDSAVSWVSGFEAKQGVPAISSVRTYAELVLFDEGHVENTCTSYRDAETSTTPINVTSNFKTMLVMANEDRLGPDGKISQEDTTVIDVSRRVYVGINMLIPRDNTGNDSPIRRPEIIIENVAVTFTDSDTGMNIHSEVFTRTDKQMMMNIPGTPYYHDAHFCSSYEDGPKKCDLFYQSDPQDIRYSKAIYDAATPSENPWFSSAVGTPLVRALCQMHSDNADRDVFSFVPKYWSPRLVDGAGTGDGPVIRNMIMTVTVAAKMRSCVGIDADLGGRRMLRELQDGGNSTDNDFISATSSMNATVTGAGNTTDAPTASPTASPTSATTTTLPPSSSTGESNGNNDTAVTLPPTAEKVVEKVVDKLSDMAIAGIILGSIAVLAIVTFGCIIFWKSNNSQDGRKEAVSETMTFIF